MRMAVHQGGERRSCPSPRMRRARACRRVGLLPTVVVHARARQAVVYLALAPKSVGVYRAYQRAKATVREMPNAPPPLSICNAPTALMRRLGYSDGYMYPPDHGYPRRPQPYLPPDLQQATFWDGEDREKEQLPSVLSRQEGQGEGNREAAETTSPGPCSGPGRQAAEGH